ncbi:FtsK/SpoIIIE domain-containing protein [Streptococcus hyovaginalis]|uniref:FtsK/SpoIIIE domain-containing protein n=1 Tax=Streptococcus hyovaginalis TaxID=149015 RepID=UPI0014796885|nr:FtsK/SpoIIIE domain-containing protein [Streptococcus hyovaginalis]
MKIITTDKRRWDGLVSILLVCFLAAILLFILFGLTNFKPLLIGGLALLFLKSYLILKLWCKFYRNYHVKAFGLQKAYSLWRQVAYLKKELIAAQVFVKKGYYAGKTLVELPKIDFYCKDGIWYLRVENRISLQEKLEKLDLSAALSGFVVEQHRMIPTQNAYIYELDDKSINRRFQLTSLDDVKQLLEQQDSPTAIPIDKRFTLPAFCNGLIVGATRSGKSYSLYWLIMNYLLKYGHYNEKDNSLANLFIIDPKRSSISQLGKDIGHVAVSIDESRQLLKDYLTAMEEREKILSPMQKQGLDKDYKFFGMTPYLLVIDEYASFASSLKNRPKAERDDINAMIDALVLKGSQLGFFVIIAMQKSDATLLPTHVRNSLLFKVVMGNAQATTYTTAFERTDVPKRQFELGEGVYTLDGYVQDPKVLAMPHLDFDLYKDGFDRIFKQIQSKD